MTKPGYVFVTPDGPKDGGDFGPRTAGTRTSGIQEALDYAKANRKDVYIAGGGLTEAFKGGVGYALEETLRIPWNQNWRLDGGEYWLSYTPESGDAVVIDSQMNCRIKMGLVVNTRSPDAVVRMCPSSRGPDNMRCVVASTFVFNGMVGAGDVWGKPGAKQRSIGLLMDCSAGGSITRNRVIIGEINACDLGIHITQGCHANQIEATWIHLTNLGIRIGDAQAPDVSEHVVKAGISGDLPGTAGVQVFGSGNLLTVSAHGHDANRNIIFEGPARDNLIVAVNLAEGITNDATAPTNRIVSSRPIGLNVATPPVPSSGGKVVTRQTRNLYRLQKRFNPPRRCEDCCLVEFAPACVSDRGRITPSTDDARHGIACHPYVIQARIVSAGQVTEWIETDANGASQTFCGRLYVGQVLILEPGEGISFSYLKPPKWRWKALL